MIPVIFMVAGVGIGAYALWKSGAVQQAQWDRMVSDKKGDAAQLVEDRSRDSSFFQSLTSSEKNVLGDDWTSMSAEEMQSKLDEHSESQTVRATENTAFSDYVQSRIDRYPPYFQNRILERMNEISRDNPTMSRQEALEASFNSMGLEA